MSKVPREICRGVSPGEYYNIQMRMWDRPHKTSGSSTPIRHLSLRSMMPNTTSYMTYEGSTTHPGCWETTVWLILNKPIYITKQEMYALRRLMQGTEKTPKAPLGNNARPLQPLHHRTVRTNIDFRKEEGKNCPSMYKEMYYRANTWSDQDVPYLV